MLRDDVPCGDVTDTLELWLDRDDAVRDYRLTKRSCGADAGDPRALLAAVVGCNPTSLAGLDDAQVARRTPEHAPWLVDKHLAALRAVLAALTGVTEHGPTAPCALVQVTAEPDGTVHVVADLAGRFDARAVPACSSSGGGCGHCQSAAALE